MGMRMFKPSANGNVLACCWVYCQRKLFLVNQYTKYYCSRQINDYFYVKSLCLLINLTFTLWRLRIDFRLIICRYCSLDMMSYVHHNAVFVYDQWTCSKILCILWLQSINFKPYFYTLNFITVFRIARQLILSYSTPREGTLVT